MSVCVVAHRQIFVRVLYTSRRDACLPYTNRYGTGLDESIIQALDPTIVSVVNLRCLLTLTIALSRQPSAAGVLLSHAPARICAHARGAHTCRERGTSE